MVFIVIQVSRGPQICGVVHADDAVLKHHIYFQEHTLKKDALLLKTKKIQ